MTNGAAPFDATGPARLHGGPGVDGPRPHDFSTGANAAGPCPYALARVQAADPSRYPDPASTALRQRLAARHGVEPGRVLLAASASEFIQRVTAVGTRLDPGPVGVPTHGYGDYAAAARAWGRPRTGVDDPQARLVWHADPASPDGASGPWPSLPPLDDGGPLCIADLAYAPLRLDGRPLPPDDHADRVLRLVTPNKALGLCGLRGAYAIVPAGAAGRRWASALCAAEPSWPLGAQAVAMLEAWCEPEIETWLAEARAQLAGWRVALVAGLRERGFVPRPGVAPFVCAAWPEGWTPDATVLDALGLAVRDTTSFGLPRHWRLNALPPASQALLWQAIVTSPAR